MKNSEAFSLTVLIWCMLHKFGWLDGRVYTSGVVSIRFDSWLHASIGVTSKSLQNGDTPHITVTFPRKTGIVVRIPNKSGVMGSKMHIN